ncbi:MAG TPA: hypothetical protein VI299_30140, partial [Polyangiales bacterium]
MAWIVGGADPANDGRSMGRWLATEPYECSGFAGREAIAHIVCEQAAFGIEHGQQAQIEEGLQAADDHLGSASGKRRQRGLERVESAGATERECLTASAKARCGLRFELRQERLADAKPAEGFARLRQREEERPAKLAELRERHATQTQHDTQRT